MHSKHQLRACVCFSVLLIASYVDSIAAPLTLALDKPGAAAITINQAEVKLPAYHTVRLTVGSVTLNQSVLQANGGMIALNTGIALLRHAQMTTSVGASDGKITMAEGNRLFVAKGVLVSAGAVL